MATESFDQMYDLFAAIMAKGISAQLKRGLYREYLSRQDDLTVLRGKIDMPKTIKHRLSQKQVLSCDYDELSENNLLNQILKTTMMSLLKNRRVSLKYRVQLKKQLLYFNGIDLIDLARINWTGIKYHRNNQSYRLLICICQLVMQGEVMAGDPGNSLLASFSDEQGMHHLYEKFILEYYRRHYPQLTVNASRIDWATDDGDDQFLLPNMRTDVHLALGDRILIIDAKYYEHTTAVWYTNRAIKSGNLYQIFTYVKNESYNYPDKTVAGMLLYAKTDERVQPDENYHIHGNQINAKTLDLNRPFKQISAQLDEIVNAYFTNLQKNV
ncbi:MAG: 5-methylcytosine-specific restriction endonuclease system specificity protein McrC [Limosilactobacillus sp.]|uniref:5-methylcytosine-specific restriction endonuclease system specificity protein McrC n=1 Tax=Limosilactobacillus sp. TaxID=2773925 RepID=UPI00270E6247|nr:5-methylcytosine-specific restriction endonuclease system specificity protein McrC [Limosilactobacillus sp.]